MLTHWEVCKSPIDVPIGYKKSPKSLFAEPNVDTQSIYEGMQAAKVPKP